MDIGGSLLKLALRKLYFKAYSPKSIIPPARGNLPEAQIVVRAKSKICRGRY